MLNRNIAVISVACLPLVLGAVSPSETLLNRFQRIEEVLTVPKQLIKGNNTIDQFGNKIMVDWRPLGLVVKDQADSQSCISQSTSTLIEAYFKLNNIKEFQGVSVPDSWSGFDIYYCHLMEPIRRMYRLVLQKLKGTRVASDKCAHAMEMNQVQTATCSNRRACTDPTAVIEDFGSISSATTKKVIEALNNHGPLGVLHSWGRSVSAYLHYVKRTPLSKENNMVFYKKDWEKFKDNFQSSFINKIVRWHATVLVGYGFQKNGKLFWIIHNSYGLDPGLRGHLYVGEEELDFKKNNLWYISKASIQAPLSQDKKNQNKLFRKS
jgi:hypothetical protein